MRTYHLYALSNTFIFNTQINTDQIKPQIYLSKEENEMTRYKTTPGFTGSEIERAAMSSGIFPSESALERMAKQQIAKGLTRLANYLDPSILNGIKTSNSRNACC